MTDFNGIQVPFLDLKRVNEQIEPELMAALSNVVGSGWYILGNEVANFEKEFAEFTESRFSVGVGNGMDALTLTLRAWLALGMVDEGDDVLVPANTYIASVLSILDAGLNPVLVDPDPNTWLMRVEGCARKITQKTRVIMPVHLYGIPCEMHSFQIFAKEHNLLILDDCAQSHGASIFGRSTSSYSDASAFSFYPGKNLGALGDAGAVVSDDEALIGTVRKLGNYGSKKKYYNELQGVNSRLDELQASILRVKLPYLMSDVRLRKKIASRYDDIICKYPNVFKRPAVSTDFEQVHHIYPICIKNRGEFCQFLNNYGVGTLIHYPVPPHKQECMSGQVWGDFPEADKLSSRVVSLPIYPRMPNDHVDRVIEALDSYGVYYHS
jgi:dTDP-4-amino-4,6-dideoxygalactose transaminase